MPPPGPHAIYSARGQGQQLMTLDSGDESTPIVALPPTGIPGEQEWQVHVLQNQNVTIENIRFPGMFLSFRGEPFVNNQMESSSDPREWRLRASSRPSFYFIVFPEMVGDQELAVDFSMLRIYPPRLALMPLRPDDESQTWRFEFRD